MNKYKYCYLLEKQQQTIIKKTVLINYYDFGHNMMFQFEIRTTFVGMEVGYNLKRTKGTN